LKAGGDFVECGVFKGDMSWLITQVIGETDMPHFYLYDSFKGFLPELSTPDDYPLNPGFLDFANGVYKDSSIYGYGYVRDRFASNPKVTVTKGFLPDALSIVCSESISFLHIDLPSRFTTPEIVGNHSKKRCGSIYFRRVFFHVINLKNVF